MNTYYIYFFWKFFFKRYKISSWLVLILLIIFADMPTIKNVTEIKRKVPPTNPDQIFGWNVPAEIYVCNKIDPKRTLIIKKKSEI